MKNLLLIALATVALAMGSSALSAQCAGCGSKATKKVDTVEVKADAEKVVVKTETKSEVATSSRGCAMKKASAGQMVKADKDCAGSCKKASAGQTVKADGCGGCGSGCGSCGSGCGGCDKGSSDCGGCNKAEAKKPSN